MILSHDSSGKIYGNIEDLIDYLKDDFTVEELDKGKNSAMLTHKQKPGIMA